MMLKTCSCSKVCTTKNSKFLGRVDVGTIYEASYFNCTDCGSTFVFTTQAFKDSIRDEQVRDMAQWVETTWKENEMELSDENY